MATQTNDPNANASLHILPAAAKDSKAMDACGMAYRQMTGLATARNNVRLWAAPQDGPHRFIAETNLRKLASFLPAVKRAFLAHKACGGGFIEDVIVPAHSIAAYNKLMGWMKASYTQGHVVPFKKVGHHAVTIYKELRSIAFDLSIGRLLKLMDAWIRAMLGPKAN